MRADFVAYLNNIKFDAIFLVGIIVFLTVLQKYHFLMLNYIKRVTNKFIHHFISFISRIGVIIHEFSHLGFGLLFGAKIKKIDLFSPTGGQVVFSTKDYISNMAFVNHNKLFYFLKLTINRIGIFLTSLGPLIVGIFLNILIMNYFTGNPIFSLQAQVDYSQIKTGLFPIFFLIIYALVFLPSFILSFKDLSHFFFYKGPNLAASVIGSMVNFSVFIVFILITAQRFDYVLGFAVIYGISFLTILVAFIFIRALIAVKRKL